MGRLTFDSISSQTAFLERRMWMVLLTAGHPGGAEIENSSLPADHRTLSTAAQGSHWFDMAPMEPEEYQTRHRHAGHKGIKYLGPIESENWPSHWPETRRKLFHDITTLGKSIFGEFDAGYASDSNEKPWRGQIKPRAAKLAVLAARCRGEGKNERSWRASLEHEVLYRFTVEVSW